MLVPEVALRFCSDDGSEPLVVATTSAPTVFRTVLSELLREAEATASDVADADPILSQLLASEVQRLRAVSAAVDAAPNELRLVPGKGRS